MKTGLADHRQGATHGGGSQGRILGLGGGEAGGVRVYGMGLGGEGGVVWSGVEYSGGPLVPQLLRCIYPQTRHWAASSNADADSHVSPPT